VSFPSYDLYEGVQDSWVKQVEESIIGHFNVLEEMLLLFIISFTSTKPILLL